MLRQSHVDMTMHYVHNSRKARNAQAQIIQRFLPNGGAVADAEEPCDRKAGALCGCSKIADQVEVL